MRTPNIQQVAKDYAILNPCKNYKICKIISNWLRTANTFRRMKYKRFYVILLLFDMTLLHSKNLATCWLFGVRNLRMDVFCFFLNVLSNAKYVWAFCVRRDGTTVLRAYLNVKKLCNFFSIVNRLRSSKRTTCGIINLYYSIT